MINIRVNYLSYGDGLGPYKCTLLPTFRTCIIYVYEILFIESLPKSENRFAYQNFVFSSFFSH